MAEGLILGLLTGPPGLGKTTIARSPAAEYSFSAHLHTDDFWHTIGRDDSRTLVVFYDQNCLCWNCSRNAIS